MRDPEIHYLFKPIGICTAFAVGALLVWCGVALASDGAQSRNVADISVQLAEIDDEALRSLQASAATTAQQSKLVAADGRANDGFGIAVSVSGDTALVGAECDDNCRGAAYVFVRNGTAWTLQAKLLAADGVAGDGFGGAVSVSGDVVLVGARSATVAGEIGRGSAYLFERKAGKWVQQTKLSALDGRPLSYFGQSVAVSGETALVGAASDVNGQSSAYVLVRSGSMWVQEAKLSAPDVEPGDLFARSLALAGDTALIGSPVDRILGEVGFGSAYVFVRTDTTWTLQQKLLADDGVASRAFGYSVALSGDRILVGAPLDYIEPNERQGSAYVFTRNGATWEPTAKLVAPDGAAFDFFGGSVALSKDLAMVSATGDAVGAINDQGSAYVFAGGDVFWTVKTKLVAADGARDDFFGNSVSLSGDVAIAGVSLDDIAFLDDNQGSAYVMELDLFADGFE